MKSISFVTLGCKVNQYDTAVLKNKLPKSKYTTVPFPQKADVYVIDTCTVTHKADAEARHYINRAKRINPEGIVVVTGCYAQVSSQEISTLSGVDYVVGNSDKFSSLMKIVREGSLQSKPQVFISDIFKEKKRKFESPDIDFFPDRTRAFLKVQDGCNYACTFCIIPYARGRSRSLEIDDVIGRIRLLRESGYKEVVLTGIHLASYGRDIGCDLLSLLKRIEEQKILNRIRLSSLDPADVNNEFITFLSESQTVCPSFHVSLQSGDEQILKEMRRRYKPEQFLELASDIREAMPESSIGTDIMVGFPGETQKQFDNSCYLLDRSELTYFHVFSYSKRKGTKAAGMTDQISPDVIKHRSQILRELGMKKKIEFNSGFIGKELEVLVENNSKGISRNYITVKLVKGNYRKGELIDVTVSGKQDDMLIASKYTH
ncbi:MAG: tRNA (N(6)-L-threonylcarbamoyladenosine(37)-C(2))-methylthiotransferase MtaB [Candidatus Dadabacteria bacterium]|nr:tRNA (N(6)-L-threonylcarbamoyladenosine(37)-C(2))-methylthiotransferase MtaB [Candidatus Dadabacteria bacterium]NIX15564.1 tRNA (N(6)-L-threonylcarbamoyladenosine(37)-C(2))-methylthiotransferase MtaB [Candidatus Dadabacteria bacterium]NIY22304.1 tRNA (N(6)-L-threonylcarbamoyladenosine(37)-C(2))-methylthiotransferase MtaB [Candidatus Dadabacteria bacterium]